MIKVRGVMPRILRSLGLRTVSAEVGWVPGMQSYHTARMLRPQDKALLVRDHI